jgi:hypothetical protein
MARPSQNLTARLTVRMTPAERAQLEQDAQRAAIDLATLARAQILNAAIPRKARRSSNADQQALARILAQVNKIGGNLNQIAKVANSNGDLTAVRTVNAAIAEVAAFRQELRDALQP